MIDFFIDDSLSLLFILTACQALCHSTPTIPAGSGLRLLDLSQRPICAKHIYVTGLHIYCIYICSLTACVWIYAMLSAIHHCVLAPVCVCIGYMHLVCLFMYSLPVNTTDAKCEYVFCLASLILGSVLCVWLWFPGLLLFFSNGEHVVITVIYHSDGLALPPQREQELQQHETAEMTAPKTMSWVK